MPFQINYLYSKSNPSFGCFSKKSILYISLGAIALTLLQLTRAEDDITFTTSTSSIENNDLVFHQIEGKVTPPDPKPADWHWATRILIDGGKKLAFLKVTNENSFTAFKF